MRTSRSDQQSDVTESERGNCPPLSSLEAVAKRELSSARDISADELLHQHLTTCATCANEFMELKEHLIRERYIKLSTRTCYLVLIVIVIRELARHYHFF